MFKLQNWDHDWYYCKSDGGTSFGFNDTGDTFAGNPFKYLAREICQNSIDARMDDAEPVVVEFQSFEIEQYLVPQISTMQDAFERAKEYWSDQKNDSTVSRFIDNALKIMKKEKIRCLRVSDFNTTGLTGSNKPNSKTQWLGLVKGTGMSDKAAGSGGSKGVGKYASFACSDLRTVFYSTKASDNMAAVEGVSHLISFRDKDGNLTTGLMYYGDGTNECGPIFKYYSLDPAFNRKNGDYGTDIFIIGFREDEDWIDKITGSVLDGFLYAVQDGRLVVKVDDRTIDKDHLASIFEKLDHAYIPEYADEYYKVLTDENSQTFEPCIIKDEKGDEMGQLELTALLDPNLSRTCAEIRQVGMKIKDLKGISGVIYFSAVMYIKGGRLNNFLRSLENGAHTVWETERIHDPEEKKQAVEILKRMRKYVKDCVRSLRAVTGSKPINLAVGEYLSADVPDQDSGRGKKEDITDDVSSISVTTITRTQKDGGEDKDHLNEAAEKDADGGKTPAPGGEPEHTTDSPVVTDDEKNGEGTGGYEEAGPDTPPEKKYKFVPVPSSRTRIFCRDSGRGEYTVVYTPTDSSSEAYLDVYLSAESQNYNADIASAFLGDGKALEVRNGKIAGLSFEKDHPVKLTIRMKQPGLCAMEVEGYGNKK
jgi:hypothetical protein